MMVKKMLLVLVSVNILRHARTISQQKSDSSEYVHITIKAVLGHSRPNEIGTIPQYTFFDDHCWYRVKVYYHIGV